MADLIGGALWILLEATITGMWVLCLGQDAIDTARPSSSRGSITNSGTAHRCMTADQEWSDQITIAMAFSFSRKRMTGTASQRLRRCAAAVTPYGVISMFAPRGPSTSLSSRTQL